jgi:hypothetical protein
LYEILLSGFVNNPRDMDPTTGGSDEKLQMAREPPKLSAAEFREYSRFAEQMDLFVWVPWRLLSQLH